MPVWITALLGGAGKLIGAVADWWTSRQAAQHDALVAQQTETADSLKGDSDAIQQVDRVNAAVDAGDGGVQHDPLNRNHD